MGYVKEFQDKIEKREIETFLICIKIDTQKLDMADRKNKNISVVIITLNEEKNIERCIKSAKQISNDIVVVDSGSMDKTVHLAMDLGARVFTKTWEGYASQKNFGNQKTINNLIFSMDADEEISKELASNILKEIAANKNDVNLSINILSNFEGKFIYHGGWYPDWHLRLFNKFNTHWNSDLVHERLVHKEVFPEIKVTGNLLHYTATNRYFFWTKMERYAFLYAENKVEKEVEYNAGKKYYSSIFRFIKEYILKMGFLDGSAGWVIAMQNARYTYLKYFYMEYLYELALDDLN